MAESSFTDSYNRFEQTVKRATRYVYDSEVRDFLAAAMDTSKSRRKTIEKSSVLWRAQRGYIWHMENAGAEQQFEVPGAFGAERMVPKAEYVGDERVNPRGIPSLYLASTKEAAMAEVRPWVGSYISLAQFKVMKDLVVVDCSRDKRIFPKWLLYEQPVEFPAARREEIAWGEINHALSRPVTPDDPITEYVPTQILAEAFRAHGYDGVVYRSLLGSGLNVAVFDCATAELINCGLYETNKVEFKFDQVQQPYFIMKHYEQSQRKSAEVSKDDPADPSGK